MKFLFDFLPIIAFFVAYKFYGIFIATFVAIFITAIQVLIPLLLGKKIPVQAWISFAVIYIFGGATIFFHNEVFIKWKPTILYALFALIILVADVFYQKNIFKILSKGGEIKVGEEVWNIVNKSWAVFFALMAVLNIYVAYSFSTESWVNFKLFGILGLTFLFAIAQGLFIAFKVKDEDAEESFRHLQGGGPKNDKG